MRVHLITAESPASRRLRRGRLIQFPQLTMPLIAALTPREHYVWHTDEIVDSVRFDVTCGARGRDGVGRAPLLLAPVDRSPARGLTRGTLVESPAEHRLHARRSRECGAAVGSGRARVA